MIGFVAAMLPPDRLHEAYRVPKYLAASRLIKWPAKRLAKHFGRRHFDKKFHSQFDDNLAFAEEFFDMYMGLSYDVENYKRFVESFKLWRHLYVDAEHKTADKPSFVTMTEDEFHTVVPNDRFVRHYASIMTTLLRVAKETGSQKELKPGIYERMDGLDSLHHRAHSVFLQVPSCTGRRGNLENLMLHIIQENDAEHYSFPSLHIGDSFYLKTAMENGDLPEKYLHLHEEAQKLAAYMILAVRELMQHTSKDAAGGMVLAKLQTDSMGYRHEHPRDFLDRVGILDDYSDHPFDQVFYDYDRLARYTELADGDLAKATKKLYKEDGCIQANPGDYCHYLVKSDGKTRLAPFPERKDL